MLSLCRNTPKGLFSIVVVSLLLLSSAVDAGSFVIPEVLQYDLTWTGVKAGEATLQIRDSGEEMKITSTARSAKWVSVFYTVNDVVESRVRKNQPELSIAQPVHYRLNLREGKHRKDKEVIFDHAHLKAVYIDYIDHEKIEFEIPSLTFDSISSFYYLRTMNLDVGKSVYVTVFDSKKVWNVEVQVLRKERVKVPAGEFDTIVVKPLMKSEGIFYRKGEIYIWLTDDKKRVPVMLKTKVKIGSITASLIGGTY
jgi:hypothetical protein